MHLLTKKIRHFNGTVAFLGFRICNNVLPLDTLIGLVNAELSILEIKVLWCESQQFAKTDTAPIQHFKGIKRNWFIHHDLRKLHIFVFCPEVHLFGILYANTSSFGSWVYAKIIVANRMVKDTGKLIVQILQIRFRIGLSVFVTVTKQFILPRKHISCLNILHRFIPEIREDFRLNDVCLMFPCILF